jgi:anti-sigma-K factor RskA
LIDRGGATITLTRLAPEGGAPAEGRDHELWLIAGGNAPRSLGLIGRSESSVVLLQTAVLNEIASGAVLAISDEPLGGWSN